MPLLLLLAGAVLGAVFAHRFDAAAAGAFIGFVAGYLIDSQLKSQAAARRPADANAADPLTLLDPRVAEHVQAMERRIAALEAALGRTTPVAEAIPPAREDQPAATDVLLPDAERRVTHALRAEAPSRTTPAYARPRAVGAPPARLRSSAVGDWIRGGNTLARVGVVVLFIGVAFLLKYASEHVTIPIDARLAGVALCGIALIVTGFRLRVRRAGYAVTLQGAGAGMLYLTVFAALRLYAVLSPAAAFALLLAVGASSSFLAIRQDAMALAVLGVLGGFAAPLLAAGGGSQVMLFSYYAVLNAAILAIAWFKAWRLLNVVGFACTVVAGTLWAITSYRPEDFATTESFLLLFFLFYLAIATLYALRRSLEPRRYVDATLVFGVPLVAASLQDVLVHRIAYALAWSAVGACAIYLLLARLLRARRPELRLLVESFAALSIVFGTLAVPLALDARLTSAAWAIEGAAVVWIGVRQAQAPSRWFGLVLQLAAGAAFAFGLSPWSDAPSAARMPIANSTYLGALLVACAGLASSHALSRDDRLGRGMRAVAPIAFGWGLAWWLGAAWHEIERFVAPDARVGVLVVFLAGSGVLFAALAARLGWPVARVPVYALPGVLFAIALDRVLDPAARPAHPLAAGGIVAWPLAVAVQVLLLRHLERATPAASARGIDAGHAIGVWLVTLIGAAELAWLMRTHPGGADWPRVAWGVVPAVTLMALARLTSSTAWPFGVRARVYARGGAMPVAVAALLWTLFANIAIDGDFAPWPYVPIANPFDVTQALVFVGIASALRRVRATERDSAASASAAALGVPVAAALLLLWVTCSTLRAVHHLGGVPWSFGSLWASQVAQSALSLVWSLFALAAMVLGNRRGYRRAWVAGAVLLGVVVAKLFAVDLAQVGGVERIVSFIGVGVLLLVIGYMAPVPPRAAHR